MEKLDVDHKSQKSKNISLAFCFILFYYDKRYIFKNTSLMYSYKLKIKLINKLPFFGPGSVDLLEGIEKTGSLKVACENMNLSYTKGRKMIRDIETETGMPVIISKHGGVGGGKATLTEYGVELLNRYKEFLTEADKCVNEVFLRYYGVDNDQN